jgi:hypothetical protein
VEWSWVESRQSWESRQARKQSILLKLLADNRWRHNKLKVCAIVNCRVWISDSAIVTGSCDLQLPIQTPPISLIHMTVFSIWSITALCSVTYVTIFVPLVKPYIQVLRFTRLFECILVWLIASRQNSAFEVLIVNWDIKMAHVLFW